jgi:hypothetical protein
MSEFEQIVQTRIDAAEDALSKVDAIRDSAVEFYESRAGQAPLLLEFWAHALRTDNPAFLTRINQTRGFLRKVGTKLTKELVHTEWFRDVDEQAFATLESGISDGIFLAWVLDGRSFPLDKAFTFRQSLLGIGLLNDDARAMLTPKLGSKLKRGF